MQRVLKGAALIVLVMMCLGCGTAAAFELSVVWNTTYGDEETNESAYSIIQAENASLIFAGDTDAKGAGLIDAWLGVVEADEGALLSDVAYGTLLNDTAYDVIQSDDGIIVFAGSTALPLEGDLYHTDAWIVGINATGYEVLNRTFGGPEVNATAYSIIQTGDGGYLFAGSIEGYASGNIDAWLVKINATGEEEWTGRFGGEQNESAYSVIEDEEGNFLFAGYTESFEAEEADGWVVKTNSTGMELWNATFGGAGNDTGWDIFQENAQNFSFVGTTTFFTGENRTDTDAWYLRFNATGAPLLEATYGGPDVNATARSAADTPDGGRLVAGTIEDYGSGNVDAWLIKLDSSAEEEWNGALGGSNQDLARSIVRISETSYVFAGEFNRTLEAQPPYPDAWAVRLDEVIEPAPAPEPTPAPKPIPKGNIGDFVWEDRNGNGIQDEGEPGIKGVEVILYDGEGTELRSRTTDSEGRYCFCSLKAGTYSLRFIRPEGYVFTLEKQGDDRALDSDANITTGNAGPIDLVENEKDRTWDAGLVNVSTIGIDVEKSTNGEDADEPPGPSIPVNATVNWTYTVTNTGLVPLFAIELVDDMIGAVSGPASGDDADGILQSGEVWVYEANGTAEAGRYENLATVNATFSTAVVNESDRSHYNGTEEIAAMIEIEKRINGELGEEPSAPVEVEVGSSVVYTLNVTNTGDAPLSNVSVTDEDLGVELDAPSSGDDGNGILDPGEMWVYHLDPVEAIPGLRDNTATVTAEDPGGNLVSASATAYYQSRPADGGAAIELEVQVADETNPAPPGPEVPVGEPVSLFFYVTNTGEVPLTNVALTADGFATSGTGEGDDENDLLDAGETWGYETSIEALEGEQQIVAAVTAEDLEGAEVNGSATGYYVGLPSGEAELSLDVEIESLAGISNPEGTDTPPGPEVPAGQPIRLIFYAMNTGSVPWSDPLLRSDGFEAGSSPDGFDIDAGYTFGPGEGCSFEESATTREGEQRVTTTVTAQDPDGNPVSGSVIFYYTGVVEEETPEEEMTPEEEETPTEEETPEDENEEAVDQIDGEMVEA